MSRDLLFYKNAIWVNPSNPLISALLTKFHATPVGGHLGMKKILHRYPCSHGYTVLLVVVDCFSKGVHLGALLARFTAYKVATLFLNIVCKHHGFPRSIISDYDPIFISSFWRELFRLNGTSLWMSTAYHPQSDNQTEVMNRSIE